MKLQRLGLLAATALVLGGSTAAPALAHHSFAMFALDKVVTVTGTVTAYNFQMPHVWMYMTLPDDKGGAPVPWGFELHSPNLIARKGWNINTVKPGDKVSIVMHPMRDGTHAGSVVNVILANGTTLWNAQSLNQP